MTVKVKTMNGDMTVLKKITELAFHQEADAPCDSLLVKYKAEEALDEIVEVMGYENGRLFFFGYCDYQSDLYDTNGYEGYIYARSSISILVDNQCLPYTYNSPTAKQLFLNCAKEHGFKNKMPEITSDEKYQVQLGTSCYGAINNFVGLITGGSVRANPDNELEVLSYSKEINSLEKYKIISQRRVINRSEPIGKIHFKRLQGNEYDLHTKSLLAEKNMLSKSMYVNLASLPQWQREYTIKQKLKASFDNYYLFEIEIAGYADDRLLQRFSGHLLTGDFADYALVKKKYTIDKNGERTKLTLKKIMDEGEISYVD